MFDAMPAVWKHMSEAQRCNLAALIETFYEEAKKDFSTPAWSAANLKKVMMLGYIKLDDVAKLRAAYLVSRGNDSVFVEPVA